MTPLISHAEKEKKIKEMAGMKMREQEARAAKVNVERRFTTTASGVSATGSGLHASDKMPAFLASYRKGSETEDKKTFNSS